jgi:hypothetical protein
MYRWPYFMIALLAAYSSVSVAVAHPADQHNVGLTNQPGSEPPDAIMTDRPTFTAGSSTVPAMRLQLEAGVRFAHHDLVEGVKAADHIGSFNANSVSAPNLLLRFGVADVAELRLGVPNVAYESITGGGNDIGFGSVSFGAKFATALSDDLSAGLISFGDLGTETGHVGGGVIATTAVAVTQSIGLGLNVGLTTSVDNLDERHYVGLTSLSAWFGLNDALSVFVETYALIPEGDIDLLVDTGVTYLLASDLQLDAYMGTQLPNADQIFAGIGVSALF